jgi:gliding motility-associated-like protein
MTGSRKLVVYKVPTANAGSDAQICGPVYTLSGTKNVGTGRWFYPSVPVVDSVFSGNNFTVTIDSTKSGLNWPYTFIWKVLNWTCMASDQATITFYQRASQAVTGKYKEIFTNTFSDTLSSITPVIGTGAWSIVSSGSSAYLQDSIVFNLIPGDNIFNWTVSNGACSTSDNMTIHTNNINIPQGFSPNGDTHNDEFEIQGLDLVNTDITLKILTSAGSQVYTTDNLNGNIYRQWNGENEKGPLPDGTYYYILSTKSKIPPYAGHIYSGVIILKRDIRN